MKATDYVADAFPEMTVRKQVPLLRVMVNASILLVAPPNLCSCFRVTGFQEASLTLII